jgi:threonine dehydrogenase-like Zn-dependent dehydrogenase
MKAVAIHVGTHDSAHAVELPRLRRQPGEYLVRVLEVGVDGTDRELDAGEYGQAPPEEDLLVIGHESLGEIAEECPGESGFKKGDLVVATVRRPCPERCLNCRNGEYDFCRTGNYRERGIKGLHGYLAEYYTERPEFLVAVPESLRGVAVLLEPLSVVEKAFRQIEKIQERLLWEPRRVLITGAGGIGMLGAYIARLRGLDTLVYSRGPASGARGEILREIGARYANARERTLQEVVEDLGAPDIAIEATGFSPLAWEVAEVLELNGIASLLSVTGGHRMAEIRSDELNNNLVLGNRLVFGSVNAHRMDFERGVADLLAIRQRWPGALERFITRRLPMQRIREALDTKDEGGLKTVIEVSAGGTHAG